MKEKEWDYMFKVILIGQSGVGKSNILMRYTRNQFTLNHSMTHGVEYAHKNVNIQGKIVKLQIWDTIGQ
jgi:Ras-related protein Rab-11A